MRYFHYQKPFALGSQKKPNSQRPQGIPNQYAETKIEAKLSSTREETHPLKGPRIIQLTRSSHRHPLVRPTITTSAQQTYPKSPSFAPKKPTKKFLSAKISTRKSYVSTKPTLSYALILCALVTLVIVLSAGQLVNKDSLPSDIATSLPLESTLVPPSLEVKIAASSKTLGIEATDLPNTPEETSTIPHTTSLTQALQQETATPDTQDTQTQATQAHATQEPSSPTQARIAAERSSQQHRPLELEQQQIQLSTNNIVTNVETAPASASPSLTHTVLAPTNAITELAKAILNPMLNLRLNLRLNPMRTVPEPFSPPLVEYTGGENAGTQVLSEKMYATYLTKKEQLAGPDLYDGSAIYDSENFEKISLEEIGDLIDEQGNDLLLQHDDVGILDRGEELDANDNAAGGTESKLEGLAHSSEPLSGRNNDTKTTKEPFQSRFHTVKSGESLWSLSRQYSISTDSIITRNNIKNVHALRVGETLDIPYHSGVYHRIRKGDTLSALAEYYNVRLEAILPSPGSSQTKLKIDDQLFVSGVRLPSLERRELFGELFILPVRGTLTSVYGMRMHPIKNRRLFHTGIDLAAASRTPVRAAMDGTVTQVSSQKNGYGNRIVIRHALGYQTTYNHLGRFSVKHGQKVSQGEVIATVGSTGLSTGPHLHFEVKHNGRFVNPGQFFKNFRTHATARQTRL